MLAGSVAGLIQDALSSGVIGIGGLAKTIVGFLVGAIGQQFIVTAALPRFVMFLAATAVHAAVFMGLYVVLGLRIVSFAVGGRPQPGAWQRRWSGMIAFTVDRSRCRERSNDAVARGMSADVALN